MVEAYPNLNDSHLCKPESLNTEFCLTFLPCHPTGGGMELSWFYQCVIAHTLQQTACFQTGAPDPNVSGQGLQTLKTVVWRGFLFLWVLGMGYVILLWHSLSLPYIFFSTNSFATVAASILLIG